MSQPKKPRPRAGSPMKAGTRPGERLYNAPPGSGQRPVKPKRGPVFTRARGRAEDEGPTPLDIVPWERGETPNTKDKKATKAPTRKPGSEAPRPGVAKSDKPAKAPRPLREARDERDEAPRERRTREPRSEPRPPRAAASPHKPTVRTGSGTDTVRVKLVRGKSKPFWVGHPWVFSGAIQAVEGELGPFGAPCIVEDERENPLGWGHYNPDGQIAVRLLWHRRTTDLPFEVPPLSALIDERLAAAFALRQTLGFPRAGTDVYRLVNAEGDFLPGLIVDRLGDVTSIQLGSRQMYEQREALIAKLSALMPTSRTVLSVTETASKLEGLPTMVELSPPLDKAARERALVEVTESGLRYRIDLEHLQKTGFYADQRENRQRFAALCGGKTMLDAYSHVGGFGLSAARAGASRVVQVDSSSTAIEGARAAATLNGLDQKTEAIVADAIVYLKEAQAAGQTFDRIVVDPPKFAQGRGHLDDAIQKYARLNTLAMATLADNGLLLTCSCSRHVGEDEFGRMLTEAGHRLRKSVRVLERWGQPADHPTLSVAPEGRYLKCWLVAVGG